MHGGDRAPLNFAPLIAFAYEGRGRIALRHGDWRRAIGFMGAAGALEFLGFDLDLTAVGAVVGVPMEVGGVGLWLYSIFDAYQSARRTSRG